MVPTPIEHAGQAASCDPARRPPQRPAAELRESWRQLQARVTLAERMLAHCDQEPVINGTPRQ